MTHACTETDNCLVDLIDGHLDPPSAMRVHAHIDGCPECRQRAELWRSLMPALRALEPPTIPDLQARRLQVEIARLLQSAVPPPSRARFHPAWLGGAFGLLAVAATILLLLHARVTPRAPLPVAGTPEPIIARVIRTKGSITLTGAPLAVSAIVPVGKPIAVLAGGELELLLDRGSRVRLSGPGGLTLSGSARDVALSLSSGILEAEVAHRLDSETFVVRTREARVDVRGTRFVVAAGVGGSWVRVDEGAVAVRFADGRERLVAAGEVASSESSDESPDIDPPSPPSGSAEPTAPSCRALIRSCQKAARRARESMRRREPDQALVLIAAARRSAAQGAGSCRGGISACQDELGYLGAETLREAGKIVDAVQAFKSLNRIGAPPAMRQNALYAAAELERNGGRLAEAHADYERALSVAPKGALHEEALVGSMESAALAGAGVRARALAQRYLSEFPNGRSAERARRLVSAMGGARERPR